MINYRILAVDQTKETNCVKWSFFFNPFRSPLKGSCAGGGAAEAAAIGVGMVVAADGASKESRSTSELTGLAFVGAAVTDTAAVGVA